MSKNSRNRKNPAGNNQSNQSTNLPQKLDPEEAELLREIEETAPSVQRLPQMEKLALIRSFSVKMHSGPLPSPEDLREYAELIPNGAERIMAQVEKQTEHRMQIENQVMKVAPRETARGQIFAFLIGLSGLGTAAYLGYLGMAIAAGTIATAALGTLAVGFLKNKNGQ